MKNNHPNIIFVILLSIAAIIVTACNTKDATNGLDATHHLNDNKPTTFMETMDLRPLQGMTQKDVIELMRAPENNEIMKQHMVLNSEIFKNISWEVADQKVRQFLEANENHILSFIFAQQFSHFMLSKHLLSRTESTPKQIEAIEYYTTLLTKFRSFGNKILFSQALPHLQGRWSKEKIVEVAKKCLEYGADEAPKEGLDFEKLRQMTSSERKQLFINELVTKRKVSPTEAVHDAAMMERVFQQRMTHPQEFPAQLPPEIQKEEDAVKILAAFAGEKFTSYEDRLRLEKQNR